MAKSHCSLKYHELPDTELDEFATGVKIGIAGHSALFPAPPVSASALATLINTFTATYEAWKRGGIDQKPAFLTAKRELTAALDDTSDYVNIVADGNEGTITAGGFTPTKITDAPSHIPETPQNVKATRPGGAGVIETDCQTSEGATAYGVIMSEGAPLVNPRIVDGQIKFENTLPNMRFDINKTRKKTFHSLTPGVTYYIYYYASNPAGVSPLSDPKRIMATD